MAAPGAGGAALKIFAEGVQSLQCSPECGPGRPEKMIRPRPSIRIYYRVGFFGRADSTAAVGGTGRGRKRRAGMSGRRAYRKAELFERARVSFLLSVVGGFFESYTFLLRGGVFSNAQTGNVIFSVLSLSRGEWVEALYFLAAIAAFCVGIYISSIMRDTMPANAFVAWEHVFLGLEALVLLAIGFVPVTVNHAWCNVIISFLCAMQYNTFRQTKGLPVATTFCTNNLRQATISFYNLVHYRNGEAGTQMLHYLRVIFAFSLGVLLGAMTSIAWGVRSIWIAGALVALTLAMTLRSEKAQSASRRFGSTRR